MWLREKKLAFEAVIGVLGVFMLCRMPEGVAGGSPVSCLACNERILAEVGVLKGSRFSGGNRRVWSPFLLALLCFWVCFGCGGSGCIFGSGSGSGSTGMVNKREVAETGDTLGRPRGVSRAIIASAMVETTGLAEMGPSNGGKLDDLAEKNG